MKSVKSLWVLTVIIGIIFVIRAFQPPVPPDRLQQLRKGMSQQEVRAILGEPTKIYGSGQWTYQRFLVFGYVNLQWQADGTFDGEFNYERF